MSWLERYLKEVSPDAIAMYEIMGNKIFEEKFDNNPTLLYKYCVENKVRWEDVLEFHFDENAIY